MTFVKRIGGAAALGLAMLIGSGLSAPPAQATYIVTLVQQGSDVLATGSGTLNLASLSILPGAFSTEHSIQPNVGILFIGLPLDVNVSNYTEVTGTTSFGNGNRDITANSGIGSIVGVDEITPSGARVVTVPEGYVSGTALMESTTWDNETFGSLGVTPGTYVWTWGSGATADSFTLDIPAASVPEPDTALLFGIALAVLVLAQTNRRVQNPG
jgi:hypothetical protein